MSSPQGHTGGKSNGGGSVRRARERMEAGLPPEMSSPPRQRPSALEGPRPAPPPPSGPRPILKNAIPPLRNIETQPPISIAISRPTPAPRWPLPATNEDSSKDRFVGDKEYQPPPGHSIPPQRPPRPSHIPSILDASKLEDRTSAFPYIPQQRAAAQQITLSRFPDENLLLPTDSNNLKSPSSRPSTISSVGTIPDFPIPAIPPPAIPVRKSTNLGPPPSSRRGASSYYSQASFVSPIPEESDRSRSHSSYASSAAIPSIWGSVSPAPYYEGELSPGLSDGYSDFEIIEEGSGNRESRSDDGDESGLVRKASLGKRGKPSLISTRSSERIEPSTPGSLGTPNPNPTNKFTEMGVFGQAEVRVAIANATTPQVVTNEQRHKQWPPVDETNTLSSGSVNIAPRLEKEHTQSSEAVPTLQTTRENGVPPIPLMPPPIGLARADSATIGYGLRPAMQQREYSRFSRLSAIRRPPRLDIEAVREAEARGSLTSLPDLIRRATRLAAMMDNGKRPGSRLNDLNDFPSDMESGDEKGLEDNGHARRRSGLSMLSDILSAFPPPGLGTPRNQTPGGHRPISQWPGGFNESPLGYEEGQDGKSKKKGKRCCGMSLCCFLILILIILIIITAAVVIPLELLVLNKHKSTSNSSTSSASSLSSCESALTCMNGGTNYITSGVCSCICTNGFTGSTCSVDSSAGCTTANFTGYSNVTIGEAIPRLMLDSQSNFSIPLASNVIISRFNSDSFTCTSENALVTFNGEDERTGSSDTSSSSLSSTTAAAKAKRFDDFFVTDSSSGAATATKASRAVATSNGIIYDLSPTPSGSATSTITTAEASATFTVTQEVLDFARVAVLYVLEKETVDVAVTAQSQLQSFFTDGGTDSDASNVTIGTGYTVNLVGLSIDLGNGTIGGTGKTVSRSRILR